MRFFYWKHVISRQVGTCKVYASQEEIMLREITEGVKAGYHYI